MKHSSPFVSVCLQTAFVDASKASSIIKVHSNFKKVLLVLQDCRNFTSFGESLRHALRERHIKKACIH
jgi:hypothetical protein